MSELKLDHIRWMIGQDHLSVMEIDQKCYRAGWDQEEIKRFLRDRASIGMVAEKQDVILGYMFYILEKKRLEVVRLGVHPGYQRMGIGRQLVEKLKEKIGREKKRERLVMDVNEQDLWGHLFLKSQGFEAVRVIRGEEDSYRFVFRSKVEAACAGKGDMRWGW